MAVSERMRVYYEREAGIKKLAEHALKSDNAELIEIANKILGVKKSFAGQLDKMFEKYGNKLHEDLIWKELKIGRTEMRRVMKQYQEHDVEVVFDGQNYLKK